MAAFAVVRLTINDMAAMGPYAQKAQASLMASKGKMVFRGQVTDDLEGTSEHPVCVVIEFPDRESALEWYNSPAYQEAIPMRQAIADGVFTIYEAAG
jgi:uncharacterized protein (DUF1330 family)